MKPVIVLIHGWGMPGDIFKPLLTGLKPHYDFVIVNLPGDVGLAYQGETTLDDFALSVLSQIKQAAVFLGWSFGALVALKAAMLKPKMVQALVLTCSTPKFTKSKDWQHGISPAVLENFAKDLKTDYKKTLEQFLALQTMYLSGQKIILKQLKYVIDLEQDANALEAQLKLLQTTDLRDELKTINIPSLWLLGDKDMLIPVKAGYAATELMPRAKLKVITGAGHLPFVSHQLEFERVLRDFV